MKSSALAATLGIVPLLIAGCATDADPQIVGTPDTLWQQARVVKPDRPWVVGLGDSYMSGEGARWASNGSNNATVEFNGGWLVGTVDQVYGDSPENTESIPYCHRSATAPMFTGADVNHANFACSGAQTNSFVNQYGRAKPGIDFDTITASDGQKLEGQAAQLEKFASTHDVDVVTLSIGGNDLGFAEIISTCVSSWIEGTPCKDSALIASRVNPTVKRTLTKRVKGAIQNVNTAMSRSGYKSTDFRLLVQLGPSPIPNSDQIDYEDFSFDRQAFGGCGMLNADLNYANDKLLPYLDSIITGAVQDIRKESGSAAMTVVDMKKALYGHRLCEKGTQRPEAGTGIPPEGFAQGVEWIRFISITAVKLYPESADAQEAMHPTYFGQRALASCMTLAVDTPATTTRVGCTLGSPLSFGDQVLPKMALQPE